MHEAFHNSIPFLVLLFVWLGAFLALRHKRIRSDAQRDVQLALLNKFQSGEEITTFLRTEEGRRLLDQLGAPVENPQQQVAGLIVPACILTTIGGALVLLSARDPDLLVAAGVVGSVGIGLFIAAAAVYVLSRRLGRDRRG